MAKKTRMSILKRQRELQKSEKAARKRAKRHGVGEPGLTEPTATVKADAAGLRPRPDVAQAEPSGEPE